MNYGVAQDPKTIPEPYSQGNKGKRNKITMSHGSMKDQTLMWQQNSYMGDSGINSGVTTQAPSLTGKEEEMEEQLIILKSESINRIKR
ncbi:hypothetical protein Phum_PHUM000550 [Pediculus humanus corporis]|uniref:Uncharacterized protein n=1 Tax=Pediculus humanus subsp. corporis TaxID=121224 RepID=E0V8W7_PEDHC|nr:uncharacterized protein Phum_PHUM000550 [Pediculus humanus corporis]EEB09823.1 hypothetical protein Phum_PHUM000550 [Pediculus humanus corporis]